jgi:hypothetical protein
MAILPRIAAFAAAACLSCAAYAQSPEHAENTGQDPTQPVTRVDIRAKFIDQPGGHESEVLTLRADRPFSLGGGWKLSTRFDLPFMGNDTLSPDNPNADYEFGLSDMLIQALFITPPKGKWALAFGTQLILPTASEDQMGSGRMQLVPTFAAIRQIPSISRGTFAGILVRETASFGASNGRADINRMSVQPIFNWNLKDAWFVTFSPEMQIDFEQEGSVFVPFDVTIGRKINARTVLSLTADAAIVRAFAPYDWQVEARAGFFF